MAFLTVSDVARLLSAKPRDITDLFYRRQLRDDICPVSAGRRIIPPEYVPEIARVLRREGKPVQFTAAGQSNARTS
jgi:hypothetical protein